jgi:hypothetical protein
LGDPRTLEQQVWGIADSVMEIIQRDLWNKQNFIEKEN